jgi:hypothetical protein
MTLLTSTSWRSTLYWSNPDARLKVRQIAGIEIKFKKINSYGVGIESYKLFSKESSNPALEIELLAQDNSSYSNRYTDTAIGLVTKDLVSAGVFLGEEVYFIRADHPDYKNLDGLVYFIDSEKVVKHYFHENYTIEIRYDEEQINSVNKILQKDTFELV